MNAYPLFLAWFAMVAAGCSSNTATGPLEIVSLSASPSELTEGQSTTFTAVVSRSGGLENVGTARLITPDGKQYGRFSSDQVGVYTLTVDWARVNDVQITAFATEENRSFVAEVSDGNGGVVTRSVNLRLHCGGQQSCEGTCREANAGCSLGACILGICQPSCPDGKGGIVAPGSPKPDDSCLRCAILKPGWNWTSAAAGTSCGTRQQCIATVDGTTCANFLPLRGLSYVVTDPNSASATALVAFSANDVFTVNSKAGTTAAVVSRSKDGGKTWTSAGPAGTGNFFGIWGSSVNDVYVVGSRGSAANGLIARSTDGGTNWTVLPSGAAYDLAGIWGSGANDVYVVGDGGTILHSVDSGATWTPQRSGAVPLFAIWGSSAADVYAVGNMGLILHSVDNGKTWTPQTSGTTVALNGIWGSGAGDVYIVGNGGLILHSVNNGATWTPQQSGITSHINGVWGSGVSDVYTIGNAGEVLHSQNSGGTWSALPSGTTKPLYSIGGAGAADVFIGGYQNLVMRRL